MIDQTNKTHKQLFSAGLPPTKTGRPFSHCFLLVSVAPGGGTARSPLRDAGFDHAAVLDEMREDAPIVHVA